MTTTERLRRIETEARFRAWVSNHRMFEGMSIEELKTLAATGQWPVRPKPAPGTSSLDAMDWGSLRKLWKADRQKFAGCSRSELKFYAIHGHWPELGCNDECPPEASGVQDMRGTHVEP
jgi:hypothetical protein